MNKLFVLYFYCDYDNFLFVIIDESQIYICTDLYEIPSALIDPVLASEIVAAVAVLGFLENMG